MPAEHLSVIPEAARPFQGRRAGLVSRMCAAGIDGVVVGIVLLVGYLALIATFFILDPRHFELPDASWLLSLTAAIFVLVAYQAAAWAVTGRTYGNVVMGLRVVDGKGRRLNPVLALTRAALCSFVPIGLLWVGVSREHRSAQDLFLRTSVIYDWQRGGAIR